MKTELFANDDITISIECNFHVRVFLKHKSKMTAYCCVFKFLRRSMDRNHLMRFHDQSETVFKFLRRRVKLELLLFRHTTEKKTNRFVGDIALAKMLTY